MPELVEVGGNRRELTAEQATARACVEAVQSLAAAAEHVSALLRNMQAHPLLYGQQEQSATRRTLLYLSDTAAMILDRDLLPENTGHNADTLRAELTRVRVETLDLLTGVV